MRGLRQVYCLRPKKGKTPALKGNQENAMSGKQKDGVQEETLAVFATAKVVDNRHKSSSSTEKSPGEKVRLEGKVRKRASKTSGRIAKLRRVIIGLLPCVKITSLNRDAHSATSVCSETLRSTGSPVQSRRKVVEKDQLPY